MCAAGFLIALALYLASFVGVVIDEVFKIVFAIALGVIVSAAALYVTPRADVNNMYFFQELHRRTPRALQRIQLIVLILFVLSFTWFLFRSQASSPKEKDGEYFLDDHGRFVRALTQDEYAHLKGDELRLFASGLTCAYALLFGYWTVLSREVSEE